MTSNVGAQRILELQERDAPWADVETAAKEALKARFRPEFLNRVDEMVVFHPLNQDQVLSIVDLLLEATRRKLTAQGMGVTVSDAAREAIAAEAADSAYGARPLRRAIQRRIETPISRLLLEDVVQKGSIVQVDHDGTAFRFFSAPPEPVPGLEPAAVA